MIRFRLNGPPIELTCPRCSNPLVIYPRWYWNGEGPRKPISCASCGHRGEFHRSFRRTVRSFLRQVPDVSVAPDYRGVMHVMLPWASNRSIAICSAVVDEGQATTVSKDQLECQDCRVIADYMELRRRRARRKIKIRRVLAWVSRKESTHE